MRIESENNFFGNFTNAHLSLVEFWMHWENAMDLQRHRQSKANNDTSSLMLKLRTNKDLERHAAKIYTYSNLYRFQDELWVACMACEIEDKKEIKQGFVIEVADSSKKIVMRDTLFVTLQIIWPIVLVKCSNLKALRIDIYCVF